MKVHLIGLHLIGFYHLEYKINNIDAKNILLLVNAKNILSFSYLAQLDLPLSQKDETWLHNTTKI